MRHGVTSCWEQMEISVNPTDLYRLIQINVKPDCRDDSWRAGTPEAPLWAQKAGCSHASQPGRTNMIPFVMVVILVLVYSLALPIVSNAGEAPGQVQTREEVWALGTPWPILAWVVRPLNVTPRSLVIMNHGIAIAAEQRAFFP